MHRGPVFVRSTIIGQHVNMSPRAVFMTSKCNLVVQPFSLVSIFSEASSRDPFVFSTLRQPRCIEWMALVDLMVTL